MVFRLHKIEAAASVSSGFYHAGRYVLFPSFAGILVKMHRFPHSFKAAWHYLVSARFWHFPDDYLPNNYARNKLTFLLTS